MNFFKKHTLVICLLVPLMGMAQKTKFPSGSNVACIERAKIYQLFKGFEKDKREIDSLKQLYKSQIESISSNLETKIAALLEGNLLEPTSSEAAIKSSMSENDFKQYEAYLNQRRGVSNAKSNFDLLTNSLTVQKIKPISDKINSTITAYAKKHNIVIIYALEDLGPALLYLDSAANITDEIIKRLK